MEEAFEAAKVAHEQLRSEPGKAYLSPFPSSLQEMADNFRIGPDDGYGHTLQKKMDDDGGGGGGVVWKWVVPVEDMIRTFNGIALQIKQKNNGSVSVPEWKAYIIPKYTVTDEFLDLMLDKKEKEN